MHHAPPRFLVRWLSLVCGLWLTACSGAQRVGVRDPGAIALEATPGNRFVPAGQRSQLVTRLQVIARAIDTLHRPPVNLTLVIDTSGSMDGRPIEDARAAGLALLDTLHDGDFLAMVTFDSRAEVLVPSTRIDSETRATVRARVTAMQARGTTAMAEGLRAGLVEASRNFQANGINRIVLLGDGVPNDATEIEAMAQVAGSRSIAITTLGLGADYNETLMGHIAQLSGGRFHYVDDSSRVAAMFRDEVLRLQRTVARNAVVTLTPGPDVTIDSIGGATPQRAGNSVTVPLGDLSEGERRDVIVRVSLPSRRNGAAVEVIDAQLNFADALQEAGGLERRAFIGVRANADDAAREAGRDPEVERAAARVSLAEVTLAAIREAREGQVEQARHRLEAELDQARQVATRDRIHTSFSDDISSASQLSSALHTLRPRTAPPAGVATGASTPVAVDEAPPAPCVREAHDRAMQSVQAY